jgi:hypothetical protein
VKDPLTLFQRKGVEFRSPSHKARQCLMGVVFIVLSPSFHVELFFPPDSRLAHPKIDNLIQPGSGSCEGNSFFHGSSPFLIATDGDRPGGVTNFRDGAVRNATR